MSKIVTITIGAAGGSIDREGYIIVGYSDPRGGRTEIGFLVARSRATIEDENGDKKEIVGPFPTFDRIAAGLEGNMGRNEWPTFIQHKSAGNQVRLSLPDEVDALAFSAEFRPEEGDKEPSPDWIAIAEEKFGA